MKIAVSSCLLGIPCKYNGQSNKNEEILKLQEKFELIPICPEVLGGLPIPRIPAEIIGTNVINQVGVDVTINYKLGAQKALQIIKDNNISIVILKSKSPSCGLGQVYDGTFTHTLIEGNGIAAELFIKNNIKVYTENNFLDLFEKDFH